ncbi:MAG: ABC transporter ATP-binding protein [Planctomycetota bacterium]|nr:ABC transporter ATP-binding protein [Planctomycetota bacterium]
MTTVKQSESTRPVVESQGLVKVFGDFWMRSKARAVDGIDFEIRPNEIFGLLGPNGSGKSTTIKLILGLLRKSKGRLTVFGRDPADVSIKRRIGYLPEESYMYRFLNPKETLDYFGKLFGISRQIRQKRTDELLEMVGLEGATNRAVGEFSKGMARRLGIAQALINDPEFLILDEPTSGLDPIGTRQVKDLLLELRRRGKTILLSSHLLADVEDVCDRMVILYGGKIRASGTAEQLLCDTHRTTINVPRLRPETIVKIDELLHREEGIAIGSVDSPRQKLEELFIQIVESARAEQTSTSGAKHGGKTAAFLLGKEDDESGSAFIDELQAPISATPSAPVQKAASIPTKANESDAIFKELLSPKSTPEVTSAPKVIPPDTGNVGKSVDTSVIDDLIDGRSEKKA